MSDYYVRYEVRGESYRHARDCDTLAQALDLRDDLIRDGFGGVRIVSVDSQAPWSRS